MKKERFAFLLYNNVSSMMFTPKKNNQEETKKNQKEKEKKRKIFLSLVKYCFINSFGLGGLDGFVSLWKFSSIDTAGFVDVCKRRVWQRGFFFYWVCVLNFLPMV